MLIPAKTVKHFEEIQNCAFYMPTWRKVYVECVAAFTHHGLWTWKTDTSDVYAYLVVEVERELGVKWQLSDVISVMNKLNGRHTVRVPGPASCRRLSLEQEVKQDVLDKC